MFTHRVSSGTRSLLVGSVPKDVALRINALVQFRGHQTKQKKIEAMEDL